MNPSVKRILFGILLLLLCISAVCAIDLSTGTAVSDKSGVTISASSVVFEDTHTGLSVTTATKIDGVDFIAPFTIPVGEKIILSSGETKELGLPDPKVQMVYTYTGNTIKEVIILKEDKQLSFPVTLSPGSKMIPWYNGQWKIVNATNGNTMKGLILEKPFGIDAAGNRIEMDYSYEKGILNLNYNRTITKYIVPEGSKGMVDPKEILLKYSEIIYPLTIDPTWTVVDDHYEAILGNGNLIMWNTTGSMIWDVPSGITEIKILIVSGGGAGGGNGARGNSGGGGDSGNFLYNISYPVINNTIINVSVGSGGIGVTNNNGGNGTNSSFDTLNVIGGNGSTNFGGAQTTGGNGTGGTYSGQTGGDGVQNNITGNDTWYGGGGGGAYSNAGPGGKGGGGEGQSYTYGGGSAGTNGLGGGGGGVSNGGSGPGFNGGSGIVIIYYIPPYNVTPNFEGVPTTTLSGNTINFTDTTNNPDNIIFTSYNWSFGDGSAETTTRNTTHIYTSGGVYNVSHTMFNQTYGNFTKTKTNYITINSADVDCGESVYGDWNASGDSWIKTNDLCTVRMWNNTGNYNWIIPSSTTVVKYLVVAGGGSGGGVGAMGSAGGGAGGLLSGLNYTVTPLSNVSIVVGLGGVGSFQSGKNSSFNNIISFGGGGGGDYNNQSGATGGSAGGSCNNGGNTAPTPSNGTQGNTGGNGDTVAQMLGGGGGGKTSNGLNATPYTGAGDGGDGLSNNITGQDIIYSCGGGGGSYTAPYLAGVGGSGGVCGGNGSVASGTSQPGFNNTGGGGGGTFNGVTGDGGSGVVIISYVSSVSPIANFTSDNTTVCMNQNVVFTDTSTGPPSSWNWIFGDGSNNTTQNPTHIYTSIGNFDVSLNISNDMGSNITTKIGYITTSDCTPVANFTAENTTVCLNEGTQFNDTSMGSPTGWNWTFGEGNTSILQDPYKAFGSFGFFTVSLNISSPYGYNLITKPDFIHSVSCTVPASITNLTTASPSCGVIILNWNNPNPFDINYDHLILWRNNTFVNNISSINTTYYITGLPTGDYNLSTQSSNNNNGINATWVNVTQSGVIGCSAGGGSSLIDDNPIIFGVIGILTGVFIMIYIMRRKSR
jgi:PKD repeat protein